MPGEYFRLKLPAPSGHGLMPPPILPGTRSTRSHSVQSSCLALLIASVAGCANPPAAKASPSVSIALIIVKFPQIYTRLACQGSVSTTVVWRPMASSSGRWRRAAAGIVRSTACRLPQCSEVRRRASSVLMVLHKICTALRRMADAIRAPSVFKASANSGERFQTVASWPAAIIFRNLSVPETPRPFSPSPVS